MRVLVLLVVFPRRRRAPGTGATYKFREGVVGVTGLVCRCTLAVPSRGRATGARVVKFEVVPLMRRTDLATGGVVRIHGIGLRRRLCCRLVLDTAGAKDVGARGESRRGSGEAMVTLQAQ